MLEEGGYRLCLNGSCSICRDESFLYSRDPGFGRGNPMNATDVCLFLVIQGSGMFPFKYTNLIFIYIYIYIFFFFWVSLTNLPAIS